MNIHIDGKSLSEAAKQYPWFHSIDLGNGIVTPDIKSAKTDARQSAAFFEPVKKDGASRTYR